VSGTRDDIIPSPLKLRCTRLADKVILIVGASSGIGAAAVRRFAEEGATIVAAARRVPTLEALVGELAADGLNASYVGCDATDEASVEAAVRTVLERHGRLDGALNTVGVMGSGGRLHEVDVADFDAVQRVNSRGTFLLMKHEVAAMLETGGSIVNTSSALGLIGYSKLPEYGASKAALHSLTRSAALAYGRNRIRVNAFAPGPTISGIFDDSDEQLERLRIVAGGTPLNYVALADDMARVALFLLSDEARWITGAILPADGGISAGRTRWL
jgi:NAD(P)-dependent dehydrogenase (short-subunit alcohol dehydrogenase family)